MKHDLIRVCAATWLGLAAVACGGGTGTGSSGEGGVVRINGAGATFPYPIYSKWFAEYNRLHPNVQINYQSQGSGAGVRQVTSRTVFFGASDSPMTDEQLGAAPGPILHIPTVLGAVVPAYNVPGLSDIRFTGPVLADIYLGKIRKWNDPALVRLNPGVALPAMDIAVVHRSDGSGTTFIWVDYLAKVSPEFKTSVGVNTSVKWPVGIGGKGNEGVSGLVSQTPGSIGYVELIYALQNRIAFGSVQNAEGEFVKASPETVSKAAATGDIPADFRISLTNAPGPGAYPISSFTWVLVYESPEDLTQSRTMVDFLRWALQDGQRFAAELGYAPLPANVVQQALTALQRIKVS
jgi:phosphate transport system substrate-binding protein